MRLEQIVQPAGAGPLLERYSQAAAQSLKEFQNRTCFRFNDTFHEQLSRGVTDRNRDACLVNVHANILFTVHWVPLSVGPEPTPQIYSERGALFYNALTAEQLVAASRDKQKSYPRVTSIISETGGTLGVLRKLRASVGARVELNWPTILGVLRCVSQTTVLGEAREGDQHSQKTMLASAAFLATPFASDRGCPTA